MPHEVSASFPSHSILPAVCLRSLLILLSGGPRGALTSAVACGILISVFEGVGVLVSRVFNEGTRPQLPPREFVDYVLQYIVPKWLCPAFCADSRPSTGKRATTALIYRLSPPTFWTIDVSFYAVYARLISRIVVLLYGFASPTRTHQVLIPSKHSETPYTILHHGPT